jgi:hypothetical protein
MFCFEEQSSVILVIKLELQHSGLAAAEVKATIGVFLIYCSFVAMWLHIGLVFVLLIEKIIISIIIQCFLIKSKSDSKIIFGGINCLKFNHEVMNQNGTS